MKIIDIKVSDRIDESYDKFDEKTNLIYSNKNSKGKSTFCRLVFYALGYPVPSTRGLNFSRLVTVINIEANGVQYEITRIDSDLYVEKTSPKLSLKYSLPEQHYAFLSYILNTEKFDIIKNLLGLMYYDQEKGWTLLNRGKVIGNIRFNIEDIVASLNDTDCSDLFPIRDQKTEEIEKYNSLLKMDELKTEYYSNNDYVEISDIEKELQQKIASYSLLVEKNKDKISELHKIIRKDKSFFDYIEQMDLYINFDEKQIKVTRENIVNSCNIDYLKARKSVLELEMISSINDLNKLKEKQNKIIQSNNLFDENVQKILEKQINIQLSHVNIDIVRIEDNIKEAKREKKIVDDTIKMRVRRDNTFISEIHELFYKYTKELNITNWVSKKTEYIFTSDLKSLSGAIYQLTVVALKVAVLKIVEKHLGVILPIVLDSPTGKELDKDNTALLMKFIEKELGSNQVIIASIYDENELGIQINNKITIVKQVIEKR